MLTIDVEWNTKIHKFVVNEFMKDMHHSHIKVKKDNKTTEIDIRNKKIPHITNFIEDNLLEDITEYVYIGDDISNKNHKIKVHKDIADIIKYCPYDIYINFGYRPLGMTCGNDQHGVLDATDERGHWTGLALDLSMNENSKKTIRYLLDNDFSRPYNNKEYNYETWHFRYDGEIERVEYV